MSGKENLFSFFRASEPKESTNIIKKLTAFTLAEVLITLAIIGVVAALTIPSVIRNYNDKKYNTARLKALKTFGEAGKMASINGEINGQPTARAFVENVLSKYLKIVRICDNDKASECNFPAKIKTTTNSYKTSNNLKSWKDLNNSIMTYNNLTDITNSDLSIYVTTADGFSAKLFYNPKCVSSTKETPVNWWGECRKSVCSHYRVDAACMNVVYDMNGEKTPNLVGEDIGYVTVFWSGIKSVAAAPAIVPYSVNSSATQMNYESAQNYCASRSSSKISYSLASIDELTSLTLNYNLATVYGYAWSGSSVPEIPGNIWASDQRGGAYILTPTGNQFPWCVRR